MAPKNMSILDFVDKNNVNTNNSVFPEREMTVNDAVIAIGKGLWYKSRNFGDDWHYTEFTLIEILRYGGCVEPGFAKHGDCAMTVDLVNYARKVLDTLAKYLYLEKIPAIVSLYAIHERSDLWKVLRRAKSPVDVVQFIRMVMENA